MSRGLRHARWRCGFTIIELMVVVAILSLLMTILLPSLQRAKHLARTAVCMGQHHEWGNALYLYNADYHMFPMCWRTGKPPEYSPAADESHMWWSYLIKFSGIPDTKLLYCPESSFTPFTPKENPRTIKESQPRPATAADIWPNGAIHGGLRLGTIGMREGYAEHRSKPIRLETVPVRLSEAQLLLDSVERRDIESWKSSAYVIERQRNPWTDASLSFPTNQYSDVTEDEGKQVSLRHGFSTNCTYMDGHVETISAKEAWNFKAP